MFEYGEVGTGITRLAVPQAFRPLRLSCVLDFRMSHQEFMQLKTCPLPSPERTEGVWFYIVVRYSEFSGDAAALSQ